MAELRIFPGTEKNKVTKSNFITSLQNKQMMTNKERQQQMSLTGGKCMVSQVVPVHHCDIRTSPPIPPTGAPWNAIQSIVTLAVDFRSLNPAAIMHAVN